MAMDDAFRRTGSRQSSECLQDIPMHTVALANRRLARCPPDLWSLTSTRRLLLSRNELTCIPDSLRALTDLRQLDVSSNKLQALPKGITALASLTRLTAHNNYIDSISPSLARLTQLQVRTPDYRLCAQCGRPCQIRVHPAQDLCFQTR